MQMTTFRHIILSAFIFACGISNGSCQTPRPTPATNDPVQAPKPDLTKQVKDRWRSIKLRNKTGDTITVSFPKEPESFEGATLTTQQSERFNADVYIAAIDEQSVVVALIDNLPAKTGLMSDIQQRDLFSGCWKGVATFAQRALEERDGRPLEINSSGSTYMLVQGRTWLVEDFTLGPYPGQARMSIEGSRAFLLVGLFPVNGAKAIINSYFETVEIEINKK